MKPGSKAINPSISHAVKTIYPINNINNNEDNYLNTQPNTESKFSKQSNPLNKGISNEKSEKIENKIEKSNKIEKTENKFINPINNQKSVLDSGFSVTETKPIRKGSFNENKSINKTNIISESKPIRKASYDKPNKNTTENTKYASDLDRKPIRKASFDANKAIGLDTTQKSYLDHGLNDQINKIVDSNNKTLRRPSFDKNKTITLNNYNNNYNQITSLDHYISDNPGKISITESNQKVIANDQKQLNSISDTKPLRKGSFTESKQPNQNANSNSNPYTNSNANPYTNSNASHGKLIPAKQIRPITPVKASKKISEKNVNNNRTLTLREKIATNSKY